MTATEGFMKAQIERLEEENMDKEKIMIEMAELINLAWLLIYDTDLPNDEKIEKIGNAINMFYDKYEDDRD